MRRDPLSRYLGLYETLNRLHQWLVLLLEFWVLVLVLAFLPEYFYWSSPLLALLALTYGLRFGPKVLLIYVLCGLLVFAALYFLVPFWQQQLHLLFSQIFLLVILPLQFYRVGRRILESSKHLREENLRDGLTRVFNRKALESALLLALAEQKPFVLTFFDLDNFKKVNDTRGHATGDKLLKRICAKLELRLRSEDRLYRLSGDEFIVLSPSVFKPDAAEILGHRIREAIREVIEVTCPEVDVSASVGVLVVDAGQKQSMSELLHCADNLMYEAKRSGKDRVLVSRLEAVFPDSA